MSLIQFYNYFPKTNMIFVNQPFEDVFPNENGEFSIVRLVFGGVCVMIFFWEVLQTECIKGIPSLGPEPFH